MSCFRFSAARIRAEGWDFGGISNLIRVGLPSRGWDPLIRSGIHVREDTKFTALAHEKVRSFFKEIAPGFGMTALVIMWGVLIVQTYYSIQRWP